MKILSRILPLAAFLTAVLLPLPVRAAPAAERSAETVPSVEERVEADETPEETVLHNLWWMLPVAGGVFLLGGGGLLLWIRHGGMESLETRWGDPDEPDGPDEAEPSEKPDKPA